MAPGDPLRCLESLRTRAKHLGTAEGEGCEVGETWFKSLPGHLAAGCPLQPRALIGKTEVIPAPTLLIRGAQKKHK